MTNEKDNPGVIAPPLLICFSGLLIGDGQPLCLLLTLKEWKLFNEKLLKQRV